MQKGIALLLLILAAVAPVFAADAGFYIGASTGLSSSSYSGSNNPVALALQGGYQFNQNFGVEVQYGSLGDIAPVESMKISGLSVVAVGILPFDNQWAGYGKLGLASIGSKVSGTGTSIDGTYNKSDITYGIGGQFDFDRALSMRFGVDVYSTGGSNDIWMLENGTINLVYVGFRYKF